MDTKGFTMIEFVIVVLIVMVALGAATEAFMAIGVNSNILMAQLSSYIKGREAIDLISKDCRIAVRVMDSYSTYVTSDDCLVLKVPSIDSSGDIIDIENEYDYIIYLMMDGNLCKVVSPGTSSSRIPYNNVFRKKIENLILSSQGTLLSAITHKSTITQVELRASISGKVLGRDYRIMPATTVKLMNYEWRHVR